MKEKKRWVKLQDYLNLVSNNYVNYQEDIFENTVETCFEITQNALRVQAEEIFEEIEELSIKKNYGENVPLGFVYMVDINKIFERLEK